MSALDFDAQHWEFDGNGDLQPLTSEADLNYPAVGEVEFGVTYGVGGVYTGTLVVTGGGPRPSTPTVRIIDNQDGTATATISGSDAGTTNTVWIFLRHNGVLELINAGSRVDDGTVAISNPAGEYIGFVVSELNDVLSLPSNPDGFWVSSSLADMIRISAAEAELQAIKRHPKGIQVTFQNGNTQTPVTVWATFESGREVTQLRKSSITDEAEAVFHIPMQTGFPPSAFKNGATITYDSKEWGIDTIEKSNGAIGLSSSFRCICSRYKSTGNI